MKIKYHTTSFFLPRGNLATWCACGPQQTCQHLRSMKISLFYFSYVETNDSTIQLLKFVNDLEQQNYLAQWIRDLGQQEKRGERNLSSKEPAVRPVYSCCTGTSLSSVEPQYGWIWSLVSPWNVSQKVCYQYLKMMRLQRIINVADHFHLTLDIQDSNDGSFPYSAQVMDYR